MVQICWIRCRKCHVSRNFVKSGNKRPERHWRIGFVHRGHLEGTEAWVIEVNQLEIWHWNRLAVQKFAYNGKRLSGEKGQLLAKSILSLPDVENIVLRLPDVENFANRQPHLIKITCNTHHCPFARWSKGPLPSCFTKRTLRDKSDCSRIALRTAKCSTLWSFIWTLASRKKVVQLDRQSSPIMSKAKWIYNQSWQLIFCRSTVMGMRSTLPLPLVPFPLK